MTLLKDNNYKEINVALLSLEADIKNKITNLDISAIDRQLAEINSRIDKINAGDNNSSAAINDIRTEVEGINSKLNGNSAKIENIEQKLSDIFSTKNNVSDLNTTTDSGIYYWADDAANKPGTNYGVLLVNKFDGGDSASTLWINQIAYGTNGKIYFRQNINSGGWTDWKTVAFDGEINADTVDNYHASQLWRSDGAIWNQGADVIMKPTGNGSEWSFDFRNKNGATGSYWHIWDENKKTLLKVTADDGKVSAPYGFVGNLSGKASAAGTADNANALAYRGEITNTDTFQNVMNNDGKWVIADLVLPWHGSLYSFHVGGSQSGLMFRIKGGSLDIRNVEVNYSVDSNKFAGPWVPLIGRIPTSAPPSPTDGDIWIER